ncbi:MAG: glycosyltransferase family 4 protein [Firmicutes bacterium]|nr:glycosyltransferase family 4 protein [Bacillota bacterium]
MKILVLTWEYPPKVVGGLARAVADLSEALAIKGHDVRVVTSDYPGSIAEEIRNGVRVYRVSSQHPQPLNFLDSVLYLNFNLIERAIQLLREGWEWDLIHAHDWLVGHAAKVLKQSIGKPMIATIHATEWGRNNGLHNDLQRHISDVEWWLTYEAYAVICCSFYMCSELQRIFQVPQDKLYVIPNGVVAEKFMEAVPDLTSFRNNYATPDEQIIFFIGRLVHEKGVHVLLEAIPNILRRVPNTKFVIAGKGPCEKELKYRAEEMGIADRIHFTGFIDDLTRNSLYKVASAAVFPSLYEPFGIVALEAMAAGTPVIVSDVGGFAEIVQHGRNGLTTYAGNSQSLADNIVAILQAPEFAKKLKEQAAHDLFSRYQWSKIAEQTEVVYDKILGNAHANLDVRDLMGRMTSRFVYERYQQTGNFVDHELIRGDYQ